MSLLIPVVQDRLGCMLLAKQVKSYAEVADICCKGSGNTRE